MSTRRASFPVRIAAEPRLPRRTSPRRVALSPGLLASITLLFSVGLIVGTALALYLLETDTPARPTESRDPVLSDAGPASDAEITAISNALAAARLGDHELATAALSTLANEAGEVARRESLFLLARTHYEWGDLEAARVSLDRYLSAYPGGPDTDRALLLRAEALNSLGDSAGAIRDLGLYLANHGPAAAYASSRLADLQLDGGNREAARVQYKNALGQALPSYTNAEILLSLADLEFAEGNAESALAWAERAYVMTPSTVDRVAALSRLADYALAAGDEGRWREALLTLIENFPGHREAMAALTELDAAGAVVDEVARARLLLAQDEVQSAEGHLLAAVTSGPEAAAAEAAYLLGGLREAAGQPEAALAWYEQSEPLDSAPFYLDLSVRKRVVRLELGREGASQALQDFVEDHPGTVFAISGLKALAASAEKSGFERTAGDYLLSAAAAASTLPGNSEAVELAARAASLYEEAGDGDAAGRAVALAVALDPASFTAIALQASGTGDDQLETVEVSETYSDRSIRDWLGDYAGILPRSALPAPQASATARELWALGLRPESRTLQREAISEARYAPILLANVAIQTATDGDYASSARAGDALLSRLPIDLRSDIASGIAEFAYPRPYNEAVGDAVDEFEIDPLLLYGLIRQESLFDPRAISSAQARGLTQVIMPTALSIAADLGYEGFSERDLYRPRVNLRFGAYYLDAQLETFGAPYAALAAYNGGPGNAERWGADGGLTTLDAFLARVDFAETSAYVRAVLQHYANYRAVYLDTERPLLPESDQGSD
jgi:peptidoglycan lytic transglycosylase